MTPATGREQRRQDQAAFSEDGETAIAFWFDAAWTLAGGATSTVNLVDIAELDGDGLIERLYIIYDTATLGPSVTEQATRGTAAK